MTSCGASVLAVVLLAVVLFGAVLGRAPFDDPGEGMHAEIAHEILATGDWITLHLNGIRYFDKPPLLYWLAATAAKTWGEREWSARLAPFVGTLAAVAATAYLGARLLSPIAGLIAGVALLTCPGFVAYAIYLRPETLFVAAIHWGLALLLIPGRPRFARALLGGFALGAAAMVKDPLGCVGPLGAIGIARLVGPPRRDRLAAPLVGVLAPIVLAAAWYLIVETRNHGFLWYTIVDNHLLNAARARHFPDEDVPLGSMEFLLVAGLGAMPWIVPALATIVSLARRRAWRREDEQPWVALTVWSAAVFVGFTLSPFKLPHYGLPAYPGIALLAARWWTTAGRQRTVLAVHIGIFVAIAIAMTVMTMSGGQVLLGRVVEATDVYTRKEAVWGQAPAFPPWAALRPIVLTTALVFGAGALALAIAFWRDRRRVAIVITAATMLGFTPMITRAMLLVAESRSVRGLARELAARAGPDDVIVHEGPIENSGALELYGGRRPVLVDGRTSVLGFGGTFADAAETFWERSRLIATWRGPARVWLVTIRQPAQSVVATVPPPTVFLILAENGRWLYSNRP